MMQVDDCIAAGTDKVDMGGDIGVETLNAPDRGHTADLPLRLEFGQVPVHRSQGDIGVLLLQHTVNHFR